MSKLLQSSTLTYLTMSHPIVVIVTGATSLIKSHRWFNKQWWVQLLLNAYTLKCFQLNLITWIPKIREWLLSGGSQRAMERDVKPPGCMLGRRNCTDDGLEQQRSLACLGCLTGSDTTADVFKWNHCTKPMKCLSLPLLSSSWNKFQVATMLYTYTGMI